MRKVLFLIDSKYNSNLENEYNSNVQYLNWNRSSNKEFNSIIDYIEINQKKIIKIYFDFIRKIKNLKFQKKKTKNLFFIENNFFLWDMSLFQESSIYKNPELNELIKIIALKEYLKEKKIRFMSLNSSRSDLYINIKSIIPKVKISFNKKKSTTYNNSKSFFYNFLFLFFFFIKRIGYEKNLKKFKSNSILICDYFVYYDKKNINKGIYESIFWKKIVPLLKKKKIYLNYLHIDLDKKNYDIKKNISLISKINKNKYNFSESHLLLDSIIDISIFLNVMIIWFKNLIYYFYLKIYYKKSIIFKNLIVNRIFTESFVGIWAIKNLYFHFLFKKFTNKYLKKNNIILYVNEFHGWEKSFVYHTKNLSKRVYGVQFNSIRDWDLRFQSILPSNQSFLYPNFFINFYNNAKKKLRPLLKIHKNINLIIADNLRSSFYQKFHTSSNSIMLIGDHDDNSTYSMLRLIDNYCKSFKKHSFEYKPHPISNIDIKNFKYLDKIKVHRNDKWLKNKYYAYVVSNKTSLGMELMEKKLKTAIVLDHEYLNFNAVSKKKGNFIKNEKELKIFLNEEANLKKIIRDNYKKKKWNKIVDNWKKILN